jgi:hypothetical protein
MRIEMLGTAFTVQHSDARVLDQLSTVLEGSRCCMMYEMLNSVLLFLHRLIYKWSHSRTVIAQVLTHEMQKLCASGWKPTRAQIRRDVAQLFGGSYEDFMRKSRKQAAN